MDKMLADEHDMTVVEPVEAAQEMTQEDKKGTEMKKGKDFTREEHDAIVARAQDVGAKIAAQEAGTSPQIVAGWMVGLKKRLAVQSDVAKPDEVQSDAVKPDRVVIPGQSGLPAKRDNLSDYTREERRLLVAKADDVGNVVVREAYGLRKNTLFDWRKVILRQDRRVETKQLEIEVPAMNTLAVTAVPAVTVNTADNNDIVPGQNGMPEKRDDPHDYTPEERRLLVAKADDVGNIAVKAAYGFKNNYIIRDWRRSLMRQPKKAEKQIVGIEAKETEIKPLKTATENTMTTEKTAEPERTAAQTVVMPEVLPQEAPISQNIPLEQPTSTATSSSAANYPPEVEVILLREKVAALTVQIEALREMLRTMVKLI